MKLRNNILNYSTLIKINKRYFSVIGLDMGGTNTCIAVMEPAGPRVIENAEGKIILKIYLLISFKSTPSYISINEDDSEYVAVDAKRIAI
jgi:molecular chaperone DnaK